MGSRGCFSEGAATKEGATDAAFGAQRLGRTRTRDARVADHVLALSLSEELAHLGVIALRQLCTV